MHSTHHTGACLCGDVSYEIEGTFTHFYLCHCSYCRKGTGTAHAANLFAPGATLRWTRGEAMVTHYRLPETRHRRSFCSVCGSNVPTVLGSSGTVMVPAGGLDTPVELAPMSHVFMDSRADWDEGLDALPRRPSWPEPTG